MQVDIARGIHSRIPPCCIAFFVTVWMPLVEPRRLWTAKEERWWSRHQRRMPKGIGYVPCPCCCRAKRFVKVHTCTRRCEGKQGYCMGRTRQVAEALRLWGAADVD
jgi:hypothetical protein